MKYFLIISIIFLASCSLNKESTYWSENSIKDETLINLDNNDVNLISRILKKTDQFAEGSLKSKIINIFKNEDDISYHEVSTEKDFMNMTFNEYNLYLKNYLKASNVPDINN